MKLEHIGIAVRNIEEHLKLWRDVFGFTVEMTTDVTEQNVRVSMLDVGGVNVELIEPLTPDSTVHKFIEKKGEGLHHLSFRVDDLERTIADFKGRGVRMIDEVPRQGAHGGKIAFVHPSSTGGILIELSQVIEKEQEE